MRIARGRGSSAASEERSATFTGRVWADPVLAELSRVAVTNVFFEPRSRTDWHTHEIGQVLYVLAGSGWVQARDGDGGPITAGDTVHIPAGEVHWHGATAESYVLHLAVSIGETVWLDEVTDTEYESALA
jgi:quercetin dioxygenase-like cupin family protein